MHMCGRFDARLHTGTQAAAAAADASPALHLPLHLRACRSWRLLPTDAKRRAAFDAFCTNYAAEQKALAAAAQRAATDGFK